MSEFIPFEIQVEIIKRLPVKPLIQFRTVSKQWKSLIESSEFITVHSVNQTQPHHLRVMDIKESEYQLISIVDDDSFPQHKVSLYVPPTVKLFIDILEFDCTHGLVCLYGYNSDLNSRVVLWNPSIRKYVCIPLPDPLGSVGFGVCRKTNDPKIVKMTRTSSMDWQAEVFTLSSGAWRSVSANLPRCFDIFPTDEADHVVIDGVIYWRAQDLITKKINRIISFDLTSEEFGEVRLPDCLGSPKYLTISKLKESLVVVTYSYEDAPAPVCDVWMMKKNGDFKSLLTKIRIGRKESHGSCEIVGFRKNEIVGFRKNGNPIIEHYEEHHDGRVTSRLKVYDPCSKRINDLGLAANILSLKMTSYSESLLLLNYPFL